MSNSEQKLTDEPGIHVREEGAWYRYRYVELRDEGPGRSVVLFRTQFLDDRFDVVVVNEKGKPLELRLTEKVKEGESS